MTDKTVRSLYWTLYLENRILKIQRNNEETSEVPVDRKEAGKPKLKSEKASCNAMQRRREKLLG